MYEAFQSRFQSAVDAVFLIDPTRARIVDANVSASELLKYSPEELRGLDVEVVHPKEMALISSIFDDLRAGTTIRTDDLSCLTKERRRIPAEISFAQSDGPSGAHVLAIARDRSDRGAEERLLYRLSRGTSNVTGKAFFEALVEQLAKAFGVKYAFAAQWVDRANSRVQSLAFWDDGLQAIPDYSVEGAPCDEVLTGQVCYHPRDVRETYTVALVGESYLGVPIINDGEVLGNLVVGDDRPMPEIPVGLPVLRILADRAGTEIRRMEAEAQVRESEKRYRNFYHATPMMLHSNDREGRLVSVSDQWLAKLGYNRQEVLGRPATDFLTKESREYANAVCYPRFTETGVVTDEPLQFRKKDGGVVDVLLSALSEANENGEPTLALVASVDVSERRRLEAAVLSASEREQRRLGRDLHDDVAQILNGLRFMSERLAARLRGTNKDEAGRISQLLGRAATQVRRLVRGLNAVDMAPEDFSSALSELKSELEDTYAAQGLQVELEQSMSFAPPSAQHAVQLYRIIREAAINGARHGQAGVVSIGRGTDGYWESIRISDDGVGFDAEAESDGFGIPIMRYRAGLIGGELSVESRPRRGTTVVVRYSRTD